jgi:DNA repair exonuclease SbcCD ATPase subunit
MASPLPVAGRKASPNGSERPSALPAQELREEENQALVDTPPPSQRLTKCERPFSMQPRIKPVDDHSEPWVTEPATDLDACGDGEIEALRQENGTLRQKMAELERLLDRTGRMSLLSADKELELEKLVEEKSEVIRQLHERIHLLESSLSGAEKPHEVAAPTAIPREEELLALGEELEQERNRLKEDEQNLMQQMREMEIQMSRERAEVARQRNELARLQSELQHQLETASREADLRERLAPLARCTQDVRRTQVANLEQTPRPQNSKSSPQTSGLFRRLFGQENK